MSYVLFFGSLLLVMFLPWLAMPSDQPSAPARTYRTAFLVGLGLMSGTWFLLWITNVTRSSTLLLVCAGAVLGALTTTTIDTGFVHAADPPSTDWGERADGPRRGARWTVVRRIVAGSVALVGLVATLPLWLVIAALIWIEDPGPVFTLSAPAGPVGPGRRRLAFRSTRYRVIGAYGRRTSRAGDGSSLVVGAVLQGTRLEKLPTLVNVLGQAICGDRPRRRARRLSPGTAGHLSPGRRPFLRRRPVVTMTAVAFVAVVAVVATVVAYRPAPTSAPRAAATRSALDAPMVVPQGYDPDKDAVLPRHRVVAYYGVPGAAATGPAYTLDAAMLDRLRMQGAEYERLDPQHPVTLGIDLVASVPDQDPGPTNTYSHRLDPSVIDRYVEFCRANNLLLFMDLSFGWSDPQQELKYFLPYLALPFVHLAIDPEWMFPRHNGVPGVNLSNVRADDINPLITAMAELPMKLHIPRKIVILHQFRPTGDGLSNPYDPGSAEIADKVNLVNDPRVDVVWHVDSVGGWAGDIQTKAQQYGQWVRKDMSRYGNFQYGGFKIFYQLESKNRLMMPSEVMALKPPPMVVTYGN